MGLHFNHGDVDVVVEVTCDQCGQVITHQRCVHYNTIRNPVFLHPACVLGYYRYRITVLEFLASAGEKFVVEEDV